MTHTPYDYSSRTGLRPISWNEFHGLCKGLVKAVSAYEPHIILAVGRGGFYPGTLIAHLLRAEVYPVRLSRRENDTVVRARPKWLVRPPKVVAGQRVLVVDEIASTGETLLTVKRAVEKRGAERVRCAVLYAHSWAAAVPDYIGLISDDLLLNPWDREVWQDGRFQFHPEYVGALQEQGVDPDPSLLIGAEAIDVAKGA